MITSIYCPTCNKQCGVEHSPKGLEPGFAEGPGEDYVDLQLNWYCSQECLDKARQTELVNHVKQYARDHYEQDGWDYIVECWSDDDIAERLSLTMTNEQAVHYIGNVVKRHDSIRRDVEAEIF